MRRIAVYKALSAAEDNATHIAAGGPDRLRRSWELYLKYRGTSLVDTEGGDDRPELFYERARQLGLYCP